MSTYKDLGNELKPVRESDLVGKIIEWESGLMGAAETVDFFAELVRSGMAWSLQGCYGRTAKTLIGAGLISLNGVVLMYPDEVDE